MICRDLAYVIPENLYSYTEGRDDDDVAWK